VLQKLNSIVLMVCRHLNNYFISDRSIPFLRLEGNFTVADSEIALPNGFKKNMWIAIQGSHFNNGMFKLGQYLPDTPLHLTNGTDVVAAEDEEFSGIVWLLRFPPGFIEICNEIKAYMENPENFPSAKTKESVIGFYSWTKSTGPDGKSLTVFDVFADRLTPWRKPASGFDINQSIIQKSMSAPDSGGGGNGGETTPTQHIVTVSNWDTFNPATLNIPVGGQRNIVGAGAPTETGAPVNGNATAGAGTVVRTGANIYVVQLRRAVASNNVIPVLFQRHFDANTETWADWVDFVDSRMLRDITGGGGITQRQLEEALATKQDKMAPLTNAEIAEMFKNSGGI